MFPRALFFLLAAVVIAGCGGSTGSGTSEALTASQPFRFLPPSVTFTYQGTAAVNEAGVTRTVPASSVVTIGPPGFVDPRSNTPVLLYTQRLTIDTVEALLYRDFFFSQPGQALVAHGSEVFGVATFNFGPTLLLPAQLIVGQAFGQQTEPYETLVVKLRGGRVIRREQIAVAGAVVEAFLVDVEREIPFSRALTRQFHDRLWFAPEIAGPVPLKHDIRYTHNGAAVTVHLELIGIPTLP